MIYEFAICAVFLDLWICSRLWFFFFFWWICYNVYFWIYVIEQKQGMKNVKCKASCDFFLLVKRPKNVKMLYGCVKRPKNGHNRKCLNLGQNGQNRKLKKAQRWLCIAKFLQIKAYTKRNQEELSQNCVTTSYSCEFQNDLPWSRYRWLQGICYKRNKRQHRREN